MPKTSYIPEIYNSSLINTTSSSVTSSSFVTASNSPAFTFTPMVGGVWKVYCPANTVQAAASNNCATRIFNTSGGATLIAESQGTNFGNGGQTRSTSLCQSTYILTAGVTYQFDIQIANTINSSGVLLEGDFAPFRMFAERIGR